MAIFQQLPGRVGVLLLCLMAVFFQPAAGRAACSGDNACLADPRLLPSCAQGDECGFRWICDNCTYVMVASASARPTSLQLCVSESESTTVTFTPECIASLCTYMVDSEPSGIIEVSGSLPNLTITGLKPGSTYIRVWFRSCAVICIIPVTVSQVKIDDPTTTACVGESVAFSASGGSGGVSWSIYPEGTLTTINPNTGVVTAGAPGEYRVSATDGQGCADSSTLKIFKVAFESEKLAVCWSDGGTYDASDFLTDDSYDKGDLEWSVNGVSVAGSVITFGPNSASYSVQAKSKAKADCVGSFTLNVTKVKFPNAVEYSCWAEDGSFDAAALLEMPDGEYLEWKKDGVAVSSGLISHGDGGKQFLVEAKSISADCSDTLTLNVVKINFPAELLVVCAGDLQFDAKDYLSAGSYDKEDLAWSISKPNGATIEINQDGVVSFNSNIGDYVVTATPNNGSCGGDSFTLRILPSVVGFETDPIIRRVSDGSYDANDNVLNGAEFIDSWILTGEPPLTISQGVITFGDGGGSYTIRAETDAEDDCGNKFTLKILKVAFQSPSVAVNHADGTYNAVEKNLTPDSFDKENLQWEITAPANPAASIYADTGVITFGNKGEVITVKATSKDDEDEFSTFDLKIIKMNPITVSDAPLPPDGKSTSQASIVVEPAGQTIKWSLVGDNLGCSMGENSGLITAGNKTGWITIMAKDTELGEYGTRKAKLRVTCDCGGSCEPGGIFLSLDSVNAGFGMGSAHAGKSAGDILLYAEKMSKELSHPRSLDFHLSRDDVEVLRDEGGVLRQIKAPQSFADIVIINDYKYEIRFYHATDAGSKNTEGFYEPVGTAFVTWSLENPDASPSIFNRFKITKVVGSYTEENEFVFDESNQKWHLRRGGGLLDESLSESWDQARENRTTLRTVSDASGHIASQVQELYHVFPWGESSVQTIQDPEGLALVSSVSYYEDSLETGRYSMVKAEIQPNGSWTRYDYDSRGRTILQVEPWKDAPVTAALAEAVVISNDYTAVDVDDMPTEDDRRPRVVTKSILGTVVSRSYYAYKTVNGEDLHISENVVDQDAEYGDPSNLRSVSALYPTNYSDAVAAGRVKWAQSPDGRLETYAYETGTYVQASNPADDSFVPGAGTDVRTVATHGTVEHPNGLAYKATRDITIANNLGRNLFSETQVYTGTGYERINWTRHQYDASGRQTAVMMANGSRRETIWGTACCGMEAEIDERGIRTQYSYDQLHRMATRTKVGVAESADGHAQEDMTTIYTYDAEGRIIQETVSAGDLSATTRQQYDRAGRMTNSVDAADLETATTYSDGGRMVTVKRPGGAMEITEYYADGQTKSIKGTGVIPSFYEYGVNADGIQWTVLRKGRIDSPAFEKTLTDMLGRTITIQRPLSSSSVVDHNNSYDAKGRLISVSYSHQANTPLHMTSTLYEYDSLGRLFRQGLDVDANGSLDLASMDRITESDSFYANENGGWWQVSIQKTYPTENADDALITSTQKRRLSGFSPGVVDESVTIGLNNQVTESRTEVDREAKRVIQTTDYPDSATNEVSISVNGLVQRVTGKTGVRRAYEYDSLGRTVAAWDARTGSSRLSYNDKGQVEYSEDAGGNRTSYGYDPETGQRTLVVDALDHAIRTKYNGMGQVTHTWGDGTYPVRYEYDDYGRMVSMYTYRNNAGWSAETWPEQTGGGDRTEWHYDEASGLLVRKLDATSSGVEYNYTPEGRLLSRTWARGLITGYGYNNLGELTGVGYSDSTPGILYTYDRLGRQKTITDGNGERRFEYGPSLQLTNEVLDVAGSPYGLSRNYDAWGRSSGFAIQDAQAQEIAQTLRYGYDSVGRFASVEFQNGTVTQQWDYSYIPDSDLVAGYTNRLGLKTISSFEPTRNLKTSIQTTWNGAPLAGFSYGMDAVGRRTQMGLPNGAYWNYAYNARGELMDAQKFWQDGRPVAGARFEYGYDSIGNRTVDVRNSKPQSRTSVYHANKLNQYTNRTVPGYVDIMGSAPAEALVTVNGEPVVRDDAFFYKELAVDNEEAGVFAPVQVRSVENSSGPNGEDVVAEESGTKYLPPATQAFEYDVDGNLTRDDRWIYTWDAENRLIQMQPINPQPGDKELTFSYDYVGRRVSKKVIVWERVDPPAVYVESESTFLYDGWNMIQELVTENSTVVTNSYAWGLDLSGTLQGAGGIGGLLATVRSGDPALVEGFYAYDANGNVSDLIDTNGTIAAHYEYDPYGNEIVRTGEAAQDNPYRFSTKYADDETGLVYYGFRFYSPEMGRWMSRDPIGERGGENIYGFLANGMVNGIDVDGRSSSTKITFPQNEWRNLAEITVHWELYQHKISIGAALGQTGSLEPIDYWEKYREGTGSSILDKFSSCHGFLAVWIGVNPTGRYPEDAWPSNKESDFFDAGKDQYRKPRGNEIERNPDYYPLVSSQAGAQMRNNYNYLPSTTMDNASVLWRYRSHAYDTPLSSFKWYNRVRQGNMLKAFVYNDNQPKLYLTGVAFRDITSWFTATRDLQVWVDMSDGSSRKTIFHKQFNFQKMK